MDNSIKKLMLSFVSLSIFRNILKDGVISKLYSIIEYINQEDYDLFTLINNYNTFYFLLINENENLNIKQIIINKILYDDNDF